MNYFLIKEQNNTLLVVGMNQWTNEALDRMNIEILFYTILALSLIHI